MEITVLEKKIVRNNDVILMVATANNNNYFLINFKTFIYYIFKNFHIIEKRSKYFEMNFV